MLGQLEAGLSSFINYNIQLCGLKEVYPIILRNLLNISLPFCSPVPDKPEVDFAIEHQGFVRLIEAKWAETITDSRVVTPLRKVAQVLGSRAAKEHWIVCRTSHPHRLSSQEEIKLVNGYTMEDWLPTETQSESRKRL